MQVTMGTSYSTVTISNNKEDCTLDEVLEDLIIPALYGLGYKGVDTFFNGVKE